MHVVVAMEGFVNVTRGVDDLVSATPVDRLRIYFSSRTATTSDERCTMTAKPNTIKLT